MICSLIQKNPILLIPCHKLALTVKKIINAGNGLMVTFSADFHSVCFMREDTPTEDLALERTVPHNEDRWCREKKMVLILGILIGKVL